MSPSFSKLPPQASDVVVPVQGGVFSPTKKGGKAACSSPLPKLVTPARPAMDSILDAVGNTPLVRLKNMERELGVECELYAKLEYLNPGGSVKDRISLRMVEDAERKGLIDPARTTLVEPTSGNTGIGLALAGAVKGYRTIICMPEKMSKEKADVLRALGAEIIRTPTEAAFDAPDSHISVAQRLCEEIPNAWIPDQYKNGSNPQVHFDTTGEEILGALDGKVVDAFVAGAGTGGTITGTAKRLKDANPRILIVGADPHGSILAQPPALNAMEGSYLVEGIGYDFVPDVLDRSIVDLWIKTDDAASFAMARLMIAKEGLLVGGSAGSAMCAAAQVAKKMKKGERLVVLLADSIRNYMSKFLSDEWMHSHGMMAAAEEDDVSDPLLQQCVGSMTLPSVHTVSGSVSIKHAYSVMREHGFDQLPVIENNAAVGVVTSSQLLHLMHKRGSCITKDSLVKEALYKRFTTCELTTKPWSLSRMLDKDAFVLVVAKTAMHDDDNVVEKKVVLSILTRIDLIDHMLAAK